MHRWPVYHIETQGATGDEKWALCGSRATGLHQLFTLHVSHESFSLQAFFLFKKPALQEKVGPQTSSLALYCSLVSAQQAVISPAGRRQTAISSPLPRECWEVNIAQEADALVTAVLSQVLVRRLKKAHSVRQKRPENTEFKTSCLSSTIWCWRETSSQSATTVTEPLLNWMLMSVC